jgi:hypothetical protein
LPTYFLDLRDRGQIHSIPGRVLGGASECGAASLAVNRRLLCEACQGSAGHLIEVKKLGLFTAVMREFFFICCGMIRVRVSAIRAVAKALSVFLSLFLMLSSIACTRTASERGVEPIWRALPADALAVGVTTQSEVLARLGPPSQVITGPGGDIFYYLHEQARTRGLILVVYNTSNTSTFYDRAIFFFDAGGLLRDYAMSEPDEGEP